MSIILDAILFDKVFPGEISYQSSLGFVCPLKPCIDYPVRNIPFAPPTIPDLSALRACSQYGLTAVLLTIGPGVHPGQDTLMIAPPCPYIPYSWPVIDESVAVTFTRLPPHALIPLFRSEPVPESVPVPLM